jgi:hypothetical protein
VKQYTSPNACNVLNKMGSYEHDNETSVSMKGGKFLD